VNERAPPFEWGAACLSAAVACAALLVLVRLAGGLGLADDGSDAPARKSQRAAVPLAGGPALILAALSIALWPRFGDFAAWIPSFSGDPWTVGRTGLALGVALAFVTGLVDDRRAAGLGPLGKLAGQFAAGLALTIGLEIGGAAPTPFERGLVVLAAVAAMNVANTFDHADGTLGSLSFAAFASAGSSYAGALAAFLGFNLARRRPGAPPYAYLGDSGSHVLGILLATSSLGLAALTLPALDLARVIALRVRAGEPVWRGDRRHLGHRLADAGRGPLAVVGIVLACAAPPFAALAPWIETRGLARGGALLAGAAGSALLLALVLRLHPERAAPPG